MDTRTKANLALLISLQIVLSRVAAIRIAIGPIEGIRLGFGAFPVIFAGIAFGPVAGALVGGLGDIVGFFINPMGPYMPHFTLTAALTGALPGLVVHLSGGRPLTVRRLLLAIAAGQLVSSVLLVPLFLKQLFGIPLTATVPAKIVGEAINIPLYAFLLDALRKRFPSLHIAGNG